MQYSLSLSSFLALVASTIALQVTSPAERSTLDVSEPFTISWVTVSSDPSTVDIVLTNRNVFPPAEIPIASNVDTSSGSYDVSSVSGVDPGGNYRIDLVGTTPSNRGILAQSGQFNVAAAGSTSTSLASFSSSTPSTSTVVSTSTITSTLSSSGSLSTITSTGTSTSTSTGSASSSTSGSTTSGSSTSNSSASQTSSGTSTSATAATTGGASSLDTFAGAGFLAMVAALLA